MEKQTDGTVTIDILVSKVEMMKAERLREILIEAKTLTDELASKFSVERSSWGIRPSSTSELKIYTIGIWG